jgi:hypothetical protein
MASLFNTGPIEGHRIRFNYKNLNKDRAGWTHISIGYKVAFEILSKELINRKKNFIVPTYDSLIFPIIFLFRHYCESSLKELISKAMQLIDHSEPLNLNHPLDVLWNNAKGLISEIDKIYNIESRVLNFDITQSLSLLDSKLIELNNVDKTSQSFRYPSDKRGDSLLPDLVYVDIQHFYNQSKEIIKDIEALQILLIVLSQDKENNSGN